MQYRALRLVLALRNAGSCITTNNLLIDWLAGRRAVGRVDGRTSMAERRWLIADTWTPATLS